MPGIIVSVDTFYADVAREAVRAGAHIVNDVSAGLGDRSMHDTVRVLEGNLCTSNGCCIVQLCDHLAGATGPSCTTFTGALYTFVCKVPFLISCATTDLITKLPLKMTHQRTNQPDQRIF